MFFKPSGGQILGMKIDLVYVGYVDVSFQEIEGVNLQFKSQNQ